jgi:hypothetical protein
MKQLSKILLSIITVTPMVGCGNSSSSGGVAAMATATELVSDPQLSGSVVNASHGDAISAVADQSTSGAGLLDASTADASKSKSKDSDSDSSTVTKTCAVSGLTAVVSISSSIDRTKTDTRKSGTVTAERTRTGSGTMTRTWSRTDGVAVACNTGGSGANVDFQNPSGLKVDLAFERSREDKRTYTSTTLTRSSSRSFNLHVA